MIRGKVMTPPVYVDFLNRFDVEALKLTDTEILDAITGSLRMQGNSETSIEPRMHIEPRAGVDGHFNVLRGWIGGDMIQSDAYITTSLNISFSLR